MCELYTTVSEYLLFFANAARDVPKFPPTYKKIQNTNFACLKLEDTRIYILRPKSISNKNISTFSHLSVLYTPMRKNAVPHLPIESV